MLQPLFADNEWNAISLHFCLTNREREVLKATFLDRPEKQIAHEMGISRHTVHTYLERIYRKTGVSSRTELVVHVIIAAIDDLKILERGQSNRLAVRALSAGVGRDY